MLRATKCPMCDTIYLGYDCPNLKNHKDEFGIDAVNQLFGGIFKDVEDDKSGKD
jgi:hypothetical protein